jgi:hypothetical protein
MTSQIIVLLLATSVSAECQFTRWWADRALSVVESGLAEDRWQIFEEGYPKPIYDAIIGIRREAYHDQPALRKRVNAACAVKVET